VPLVNGEPVATAQAQIKAQHLRSTLVYRIPTASGEQSHQLSPAEGTTYQRNLVTLFVSRTGTGRRYVGGPA
jgi:hypothetical protein